MKINKETTIWKRNGNNTYYDLGSVGIGTTTPSTSLDVVGGIKSSSNISGLNVYAQSNIIGDVIKGDVVLSGLVISGGNTRLKELDATEGVSIGVGNAQFIGNPALRLHSSDGTTTASNSNTIIRESGVAPILVIYAGTVSRLTMTDAGNLTLTGDISGQNVYAQTQIQGDNVRGDVVVSGLVISGGLTRLGSTTIIGPTTALKISVNDSVSDGTRAGVWIWNPGDANHVMYSAAVTGGINPAGGSTISGLWDANHRFRFRTATGQGFLFENNAGSALVDIDSDNGDLASAGKISGLNLYAQTQIQGDNLVGDVVTSGLVISGGATRLGNTNVVGTIDATSNISGLNIYAQTQVQADNIRGDVVVSGLVISGGNSRIAGTLNIEYTPGAEGLRVIGISGNTHIPFTDGINYYSANAHRFRDKNNINVVTFDSAGTISGGASRLGATTVVGNLDSTANISGQNIYAQTQIQGDNIVGDVVVSGLVISGGQVRIDYLAVSGNTLFVSGGKVGIRTASFIDPTTNFIVNIATNENVAFRDSSGEAQIRAVNDAVSAHVPLSIDSSSLHLNSVTAGNVGIGTASPTQKLHVSGNIQGDSYIIPGVAGSSIAVNDIVFLGSNTKWYLADADFGSFVSMKIPAIGIADVAVSLDSTIQVVIAGKHIVNKGAETWTVGSVGMPVYVSTSSGVGTVIAPTAAGAIVFKIGNMSTTAGEIVVQPQYVGENA